MFDVYKKSQSEKRSKQNREKELNHIHNLDEKLERIAAERRSEDIDKIYPEGVNRLATATDIVSGKSER